MIRVRRARSPSVPRERSARVVGTAAAALEPSARRASRSATPRALSASRPRAAPAASVAEATPKSGPQRRTRTWPTRSASRPASGAPTSSVAKKAAPRRPTSAAPAPTREAMRSARKYAKSWPDPAAATRIRPLTTSRRATGTSPGRLEGRTAKGDGPTKSAAPSPSRCLINRTRRALEPQFVAGTGSYLCR